MSMSALSTIHPSVTAPVAAGSSGQTGPSVNAAAARSESATAAPADAEPRAKPPHAAPRLSPEQEAQVRELQRRDAEVRAHEQAHASVGGPYAGAPRYETTRGPDNRTYAIGGEVEIDLSPIPGDPAATIEKMAVVKRAALAPMEPSAQDRRVAQKADQLRLEAERELRTQETEARRASPEDERQAPPSLVREATNLYELVAQAFRPEAAGRTLAMA